MPPSESLKVTLICIATIAFWIGARLYLRSAISKLGKEEEAKRTKSAIRTITSPLVGMVVLGIVSFNWNRMPSENHVLAVPVVALGVGLILYGFYHVLRTAKS